MTVSRSNVMTGLKLSASGAGPTVFPFGCEVLCRSICNLDEDAWRVECEMK